MEMGGKREGAGRPRAAGRKPGAMIIATDKIDRAQPKAAQTLIDALEATMIVSLIAGKDKDGKNIYKHSQVPDHNVRVKAASILLNKRIPDITKLTGDKENPLTIVLMQEDLNL